MKKFYSTLYATIGLSAISLSLSGMELQENTIKITPTIVSLFSTEHQPKQIQQEPTNKIQYNIDFSIPSNIERKTMIQLVDFLDQCLTINTNGLEALNVSDCKNLLKKNIENNTLEDLIKLLNAIDDLKIVPKHNDKELILPSLMQQIFLDKITKEDYTNRKKIIDKLNNTRQTNLSCYLINNINNQKDKKNLSQTLFDLFIQFKNNSKKSGSSLNKLTQITTPKDLQNHLKLTLEQVLLINDILKKNSPIKSMLNLPIPNLVKIIILEDFIQKDNQKLAPLSPQKQEHNIAQEKEYNSYRAQFARIKDRCKQFLTTYKKRLGITLIVITHFSLYGCWYMYSNQLKTALSSLFGSK